MDNVREGLSCIHSVASCSATEAASAKGRPETTPTIIRRNAKEQGVAPLQRRPRSRRPTWLLTGRYVNLSAAGCGELSQLSPEDQRGT